MYLLRDYQPADYEACLAVFASNVPRFFGAHEQADFARFLSERASPYLVVEVGGHVVACGGYYVLPAERLAGLAWGMVAGDQQRRGIGTALLRARLERLAGEAGVAAVRVNTSQHTAGFFQRFGFQVEQVVERGFAHGLHRYEMRLQIGAAS